MEDPQNDSILFINDTRTKAIYRHIILRKFFTPQIKKKWQEILHLSFNLEWSEVWDSIWKNPLMDHEDKQLLYKPGFVFMLL